MAESNIIINIRSEPTVPNLKVITLKGTFDAVTSMNVDKKVLPIIEHDKAHVILDISKIDYLSSGDTSQLFG